MVDFDIPFIDTNANFLDTVKGLDKAFISFSGMLGIAGFEFDIERETKITLKNRSTDHYLEDNTYINDNIALAPEMITMSGDIGEISDIIEKQSTLSKISQNLTMVLSYLPDIAGTAESIMNNSNDLLSFEGLAGTAESLFGLYSNLNIPDGKQQKTFLYFESLRNARTLFTVKTCYRSYTNMAIDTIEFKQGEENKDISRVVITLKRLRFVEPKKAYKEKSTTGRLTSQVSDFVDKGLAAISDIEMPWSGSSDEELQKVVDDWNEGINF